MVNNEERLVDVELAIVEDGVCNGRLFVLAAGATAREWRFPCTVVVVAALSASETIFPFKGRNVIQASFLIAEQFR